MKKVLVDEKRIKAFAEYLSGEGRPVPFDFCSASEGYLFPACGDGGVLDYFFFCCAHQFGFWNLENNRWSTPMIAKIDGRDLKGSDFLWRAATRALQKNPNVFSPPELAAMNSLQLDEIFRDDMGDNPLPMWPEHLELIRQYADWFVVNALEPADLLNRAAAAPRPLQTLLDALAEVPGYAEDPLQKKAMLLAIVLENRPEHFLKVTDPQSARPIIDYHLQRSALRTGLVTVEDSALRAKLEARELVTAGDEAIIRSAVYEAIDKLVRLSGLSVAAIDWFFFKNRTGCPEVTAPKCAECPVQKICARNTKLFQPVFRTTYY